MMLIPLFDVDWTLLKGGITAHAEAFRHAFKEVYGVDGSIEDIEYHGMTDRQVIVEVLNLHGVSLDQARAKLPEVWEAILKYFYAHENESEFVPLPGVVSTLQTLQTHHVPCGLLTGNLEPIAWRKMGRAGLRPFLSFGAFGDATERRVELIEIARQRCRAANSDLGQFEVVIIGDAPRDVQCAKEGGIPSVAVASGKYTKGDLARTEPDLLLNSLEETEKLLAFLQPQSASMKA